MNRTTLGTAQATLELLLVAERNVYDVYCSVEGGNGKAYAAFKKVLLQKLEKGHNLTCFSSVFEQDELSSVEYHIQQIKTCTSRKQLAHSAKNACDYLAQLVVALRKACNVMEEVERIQEQSIVDSITNDLAEGESGIKVLAAHVHDMYEGENTFRFSGMSWCDTYQDTYHVWHNNLTKTAVITSEYCKARIAAIKENNELVLIVPTHTGFRRLVVASVDTIQCGVASVKQDKVTFKGSNEIVHVTHAVTAINNLIRNGSLFEDCLYYLFNGKHSDSSVLLDKVEQD